MKELWQEENGNMITLGVTAELQEEAGDIAYVSIASLGEIDFDDTLLNLEASKAAIEVPSHIKGNIIERNEKAESEPALLNSTNRSENWLVKIEQV